MVLGHADRVVAVEAVGGDRRRVDEPADTGGGRCPEDVAGALDVDGPRDLGTAADDHERQVHDDVRFGEGLLEAVRIADVTLVVGHLRPAVLVGVERTAAPPR